MDQFNYLYTAAIALPSETESQKVLKSMYMTKTKKLFGYDRSARDLKFNPTRTCSRCNSLWSDGGCRITIKSRRKGQCKNRRKCRQLVGKHYKFGMPSGRFTRMAKFFARKLCRQVTFHCNLCDYKQGFYLRPKLRTVRKTPAKDEIDASGKKRKKSKKKQFAGLDRRAMRALKGIQKTPVKKLDVKIEQKKKNDPPKKPVVSGKVSKNQSSSGSKKLSKSGMLQLAQLLKNKDQPNVNKLEMMFK